jgi:hypothetical protein
LQGYEAMPQRILKPAWEGIKSPITLKSLLLFLAVGFILYTVIRDNQQRQAATERYRTIAQYTEESRAALESAKQQTTAFEQSLRNTEETLKFMTDLRSSMHDVAELLKINRQAQAAEHRALYNGNYKVGTSRVITRRSRRRPLQPCYELRPIEKKYGGASVVVNTLIETKCP